MGEESHLSSAEVVVVEKLKGRNIRVDAHSQILRIISEDSHLGQDIGEGILSSKFGVKQFMVFSRHILPASPLSGKSGS